MRKFKIAIVLFAILSFVCFIYATELKLFLPWYRWKAVKMAEKFYYQTKNVEIEYDYSKCQILTDCYPLFYQVVFHYKDYPEKDMWVYIEYNMNNNQFENAMLFK